MKKLSDIRLKEIITDMPRDYQDAVEACVMAAKSKTSHGRRYTNEWIYKCLLLRMKSGRLYRKMVRDNFLPLPSLMSLQRYIRKLRPTFGFKEEVFQLMAEKGKHMTGAQRRGK